MTSSRGREKRIKILVTDRQPIDPPIAGGRVRIYYLFREVARYCPVTYVGMFDYLGPEPREQILGPGFTEILIPLTDAQVRLNSRLEKMAGGRIVSDVTMPLLLRYTPRFREVVSAYARDARIVIVSHPWVSPYVERRPGQILIYNSHNCEYLIKQHLLGDSLVGRLLVRMVKRVEGRLSRASDLVFAVTEEDKKRFVELYGIPDRKIVVIPDGVDTREIRPVGESERERAKKAIGMEGKRVILFVGSWYDPNVEAVDFILTSLAHELPECQFVIIGGAGEFYLRSLGTSAQVMPRNAHVLGTVDRDVRDTVYRATDVAINPMFAGSGMNIKVLDYMAAGLPVITTRTGARGLQDSDHAFIAAEAGDFARHIRMVLENRRACETLGTNGRTLVESRFDWRLIAEKAWSVIQDCAATV